jgi:hypothetical protein
VKGHRDNLLKSFMRLSFLTVHTTYEAYRGGQSLVGTPTDPGGAYGNLFTTTSSVSATGSLLKIAGTIKSMAPPDKSALANNTQDATNVVMGAAQNVWIEALESLGDPKKVGTEFVTQMIGAIPIKYKADEWKLTDEDFEILRREHLELKWIDKAWADSFKANLERLDKVKELEAKIKELEKELAEWETKEKNRVKASLVDSCKKEKEKKCDSEHLYLCDNENDCKTAGGYWYNNNCNYEPEEEDTSDGDTSDGEFNCPIPIPNEASHIVEDDMEYWSTPSGFVGTRYVGPRYSWYDREKTKKWNFACYNIEGELHGVSKMWYEDGTPKYEKNYKDGKLHGVYKWWYGDGTPKYEENYKDGKEHGVCKEWYDDGTPKSEHNYKDGKEHGVCKEWYDDGTPKSEHNYKDGKLHGVSKGWSANGKLIRECNYEEGKCVSCVHGRC